MSYESGDRVGVNEDDWSSDSDAAYILSLFIIYIHISGLTNNIQERFSQAFLRVFLFTHVVLGRAVYTYTYIGYIAYVIYLYDHM